MWLEKTRYLWGLANCLTGNQQSSNYKAISRA